MKESELLVLQPTRNSDGWQEEWPVERNTLWWFFGHRFARYERERELLLVEVRGTRDGSTVYICGGNFLYASEVGWCRFRRVDLPPLPVVDA